ncbi:MAG: hypothetical protein ABIN93_00535, partial [Ginsengibacter sp.]
WSPSFIESNGEMLSQEQKSAISKAFGTRVVNAYGAIEIWSIAYECPNGHLHLSDDVFVEVKSLKDDSICSVGSGEYGELLITSTLLKSQPFIRYKIGDIACLFESRCLCGLKNPILHLHEARTIHYINRYVNDIKMVNGVSLFKGVIWDLAVMGYDEIERYKVIQKTSDVFDVHLVASHSDEKRFRQDFIQCSEKRLAQRASFNFYYTTKEDPVFTLQKDYSFISNAMSN